MKTNRIGLDATKARELAEKLNLLLANFQLFYMNSRGFHWNIKGEKFFELHLKFEELYTDSLKLSKIKEKRNVTDGKEAVKSVVEAFGALLDIERELLSIAADAEDEGTNALMSDYIRQQEKQVWMYSAYLDK